jgi:cyclic pyranopterin phosphate synthase
MPFSGNRWNGAQCVPASEMRRRIEEQFPLRAISSFDPHAVARDYAIEGFAGRVGFITSMSDHFCDGCNRLRLTADGAIRSCLFQPDEIGLRDPLRNGADDPALERLIRSALDGKWQQHPPASELIASPDRAMTRIGG